MKHIPLILNVYFPNEKPIIWCPVPQPPYSQDLTPCDFWLFPKLTGCRYEEMKKAVMQVIDTLTEEDFHGVFQKLSERYNKYIAAGGDYFEGGLEFHVCTINKSVHT